MVAAGKCVSGITRKNNEDAIYLSGNFSRLRDLYIVADGMGGYNCGEVASNCAIAAFIEYIDQNYKEETFSEDVLDLLIGAAQYANFAVYQKSVDDQSCNGMGTTFLAAVIQGGKIYIVHIGDSRLYLYRDGILRQVTKDHSFVMEMVKKGKLTLEEAAVHPKRNVITRALGVEGMAELDTYVEPLEGKDIILMCSDGLHAMIDDEQIQEILSRSASLDVQADALVDLANRMGGKDNISVILITQEVRQ